MTLRVTSDNDWPILPTLPGTEQTFALNIEHEYVVAP